jgi:hypothetical protein
MKLWLESTPGGPNDWLFPSENRKMPIAAENMMARYIRPKLKSVGLGWVARYASNPFVIDERSGD